MTTNRPNRLRAERQKNDWTQIELSELTGIIQSQISEYEAGVVFPTPRNILRLAEAFGVPEAELYEWLRTPVDDDEAAA